MATAVPSPLVFFSFLFSVVACLARDASIGRPTRAAPPAQSQGADSPGPGDCGRISLCLLDVGTYEHEHEHEQAAAVWLGLDRPGGLSLACRSCSLDMAVLPAAVGFPLLLKVRVTGDH